ncbi:MAG: ribonuclease Y [Myxococcales bacterium]|nr:ribonuclease Y [Myxococcales bacterium]
MEIIIASLLGVAVGVAVGLWWSRRKQAEEAAEGRSKADQLLEDAKKEAERAKKELLESTKNAEERVKSQEEELKEQRLNLQKLENRLLKKDEAIEKKGELITGKENDILKKERQVVQRETQLRDKEQALEEREGEIDKKLEEVAGLTREAAREQLTESIAAEAKIDAAKEVKAFEEQARADADRRAKKMLAVAVSRYAGEYVSEATVTVVNLPSEDMKGRIIGREGRNIRAFEAATGVDMIIDDTPEAVVLSAFNPVRREVARLALERLIADGRIHPTRIEEVVDKATKDVEQSIREAGEFACYELGLHNVHSELVKYVGRLKYRTSYAQNNLMHSIEVGFLCGVMAAELGVNVKMARRAGLFHDIGKAVDHDVEGSHAVISGNLCKKYGEHADVIHAVAAHHEDEKPSTILAHILIAADALSGARPGARREMLQSYIQRLDDLENITRRYPGVEKAYALQAGREVRVLVENSRVDDAGAIMLSREIARTIEDELTYPGQIKVTVIRETRAVEYAK